MSVVFYQRNYTAKIPPSFQVDVERYSWNMVGGPEKAYLTSPATPEMWELMKLLRCPVEIYGSDGRLNWWGYVNRVTVPHGEQRVGLGLDQLNNYVFCDYDGGTTSVTQNATSILEYGQKEKRLNDANGTQTDAERYRNMFLADREYAHPEIEFSGGQNTVQIECYGWYKSLEWKYYTSTDTTNVEHTTQIASIVSATGQFLRGTIIEDLANLTSTAERDGKQTGLYCVNELLQAGTSNARPLLVSVDKDRYLHVYERNVEATEYLLREDGELITNMNLVVPAEYCLSGVWVQVKDLITSVAKSTSGMRPFYVESAEYDAKRDKTSYRVAGAYDQTRLSKYVEEKTRPPVDEFPPIVPPVTGGVTDYAMKAFYRGTQVYTVSSGITLTNQSTTNYYEIDFTPAVSGVYIVGASIHHIAGGVTNVYATTYVLGVANYDTNLTKVGGQSQSLTTDIYSSVSVSDYILSTQAVRVLGVLSSNSLADDFFMFVVRLT